MHISYDFHIHSCLSPCGDDEMTPNNIVNMAKIIGLDAIAVCDHNSVLNLPAIFKVAEENELIVVPAMEICSAEEVHLLCFAYTLDDIFAMYHEIYEFLPAIDNDPLAFGNQFIINHEDKLIGIESKLLVNALTLDIDTILDISKKHNCIIVPAHVDKQSYSLMSSLGYIPPDYNFKCIELKNIDANVDFNGRIITNSDAHSLEIINEPINSLEVDELSIKGILDALIRNDK